MAAGVAALRAAALRALHACLLAPCPGQRPPFLSQALALFREGAASVHPGVTAVCCEAGLGLEALLHPRALPIAAAQPGAYAGAPWAAAARMIRAMQGVRA